MMKPRYSNLPSSMLPFIDLLSNVIGSLCMIILVASLTQGIPGPAASDDDAQVRRLVQSAERKMTDAASVRASIEAATAREAELEKSADAAAAMALQQQESVDARITLLATLSASRQNYREKIADLERRRLEFNDLLKSLREQLAARHPGSVPRDKIEIHFAGRGRGLKPSFVECTAMGVLLHTASGREMVDRNDIQGSDAIAQLLSNVMATPQGTLIILVRPDGLKTLPMIESIAEQRKVRHGKLPIPGDGDLDFGPYDPARSSGGQEK